MPDTEEVQVDDNFFNLLDLFSKAADMENVPWLLVGASARVLLLEKIYGWSEGVATADIDFAVQVKSWVHYDALCTQLKRFDEFEALQSPTKRFTAAHNLLFDLLPYGGVETEEKQVYWPPNNDELMTVRGFDRAHKDAIIVTVNEKLDVPVISPRGLCALKLFAWEERHTQHPGRDAKDLAYLFHNIERLYSAEILHTEYQDVLADNDYDIELAAVQQFGASVKELLEVEENKFLSIFLANEIDREDDSILVRNLHRYFPLNSIDRVVAIVKSFYQPFS